MLEKVEAIVLRTVRYGESRIIADLYTRERGLLPVILSLPRSSRGRLKIQYFQPLTLLSAEVDVRPNQALSRLRECMLSAAYSSLHQDAVKTSLVMFLSECLSSILKWSQPEPFLFDYVRDSLLWLDATSRPVSNFHLVFLVRLTRFLGIAPRLSADEPQLFDLREGQFAAFTPLHGDFLSVGEARLVPLFLRLDYSTMHLLRLSREERQRCLDVVLSYYRLHLPSFSYPRSLAVLQQLWD